MVNDEKSSLKSAKFHQSSDRPEVEKPARCLMSERRIKAEEKDEVS